MEKKFNRCQENNITKSKQWDKNMDLHKLKNK